LRHVCRPVIGPARHRPEAVVVADRGECYSGPHGPGAGIQLHDIARPDGRDSVSGSYRVGRRTYRDKARDPGRSTWGKRARGRHGWVRARAPRRAGVRARRAIDTATQRRCAQRRGAGRYINGDGCPSTVLGDGRPVLQRIGRRMAASSPQLGNSFFLKDSAVGHQSLRLVFYNVISVDFRIAVLHRVSSLVG
jgi:hypothetical protein